MALQYFHSFIIRTPYYSVQSKVNLTKEQLFISSFDLQEAVEKKNHEKTKKKEKINKAIESYNKRSKSRCTPFGLLAGVGVGSISESSDIQLLETNIKRHTRFDSIFLLLFIEKLNSLKYLTPLLHYYPNDTIYKIDLNYYYTEYYYNELERKHRFNKIEFTEYIETIIANSQKGILITEIIDLIKDGEISLEEKNKFVNDLIENKILLSEFFPSVTGLEIEKRIFEILLSIKKRSNDIIINYEIDILIKTIQNIFEIKTQIDKNGVSDKNLNLYEDIILLLKNININYDKKHLFQVDYIQKYNTPQINKAIPNKVIEGLNGLVKLYDAFEIPNLKEFREQFYTRWQDEEILLTVALDNNYGLGYPTKKSIGDISDTPFINTLPLQYIESQKRTVELNEKLFIFWSNKINSAIVDKTIIHLTKKEIEILNDLSTEDLPTTLSVLCSVLDNSENPTILIRTVGGSSAIQLISRFAYYDENINLLCKSIALKEEELNSNSIVAEISHYPEARVGNIIQHPHFYKFNISFLNNHLSDVDDNVTTITIDDIFVKIVNQKIHLRSKKFNKQIIPKLSNAHAYFLKGLPIYHFLCDLQYQSVIGNSSFHIPIVENKLKYIPRVVYENNIILSPATWNLTKLDIENCFEYSNSNIEKINLFKHKWGIPSLFLIIDGENELLIDTNDDKSANLFIAHYSSKSNIKIEEYLFDETNSFLKSEIGNSYNNEILFCFYNKKYKNQNLTNQKIVKNNSERKFQIGSEWIYYKIYCNSEYANEIIVECYQKVLKRYIAENKITLFFFIKHKDPHYHIRYRIKLSDISYFNELFSEINSYFLIYTSKNLIWKIQLDTYDREVERYGSGTIDIAEKIFFIDSLLVIKAIFIFKHTTLNTSYFYYYCILTIDSYLTIFTNNDIEMKLKFCYSQRESFKNEFRYTSFIKQQLDNKFRIEKKTLFDFMKQFSSNKNSSHFTEFNDLRKQNNIFLENLQVQFALLIQEEKDTIYIQNYLSSYIHMSIIRFCKTNNRAHEFVFYDVLEKYYRYSLGAMKHSKQQTNA